jgi:hypothetical protein
MSDSTVALMDRHANGQPAAYERALITGDLAKLTPDERLSYYKRTCDSLGLNPLTRPFDYLSLNGKLILYARKDCTEQLRNLHGVSVKIVAREVVEDCYVVTANARMANGREDESIGAVSIQGLKGEVRANAMMKAETKAKRRVTLSICGLGMLDETEVESIPNAYRDPLMSVEENSLSPQEQLAARKANPQPAKKEYCSQAQYDALRDIGDELGLTPEERVEVLKPYGVTRGRSLSPEQAAEAILSLCRRRVSQLLTELALNLDDVRVEAPTVAADTPDELDQPQADAALTVLRKCKENASR